jgi:hypothetical protein
VDLLQWLTDHNLLDENCQPDKQIASTTAIHFRYAVSPLSYAVNRYFFSVARNLYLITIGAFQHCRRLDYIHLSRVWFTIKFPDGWTMGEINSADPLLVGHAL